MNILSCKKYYCYRIWDPKQEKINSCKSVSRLAAAKHFAEVKRLPLKEFLKIYSVSR